jgi:hypothetical protein
MIEDPDPDPGGPKTCGSGGSGSGSGSATLKNKQDKEGNTYSECFVPRDAGQLAGGGTGTEGERADRPLVARQDLQQPARRQRPQVDLKHVLPPRHNQIAGRVHAETAQLDGPGRRQRFEVAIARHVEGPDGAVQRGAEHHLPVGREGEAGDAALVLREGDEAEAGGRVPQLHLNVMCCININNCIIIISGVPRGDAQDARASPPPLCASPPRPCAIVHPPPLPSLKGWL